MLNSTPVFGRRLSLILAIGMLLQVATHLYVAHRSAQSQLDLMTDLRRHDKVGHEFDTLTTRLSALAFTTAVDRGTDTSLAAEMQKLRATDAAAAAEIAEARRKVEMHEDNKARQRTALAHLDRIDASRAVITAASERALRAMANGDAAGSRAEIRAVRDAVSRAFVATAAVRGNSRKYLLIHVAQANSESERLMFLERVMFGVFLLMVVGVVFRARRAFIERMQERERTQRVTALLRRNEVLEEAVAGIATFDQTGRCT